MDIEKIMSEGVVFKKAKGDAPAQGNAKKGKSKKSSYVKGLHGSDSAKMKAAFKKKKKERRK